MRTTFILQTLQACPASAIAHELFRDFSYVGGIALLGIVGLNKRTADVISVRFSNLADRVFTVSMTTPWNIMHQLQTWASMLQDHMDKLALSAERTKALQRESEWLNHD